MIIFGIESSCDDTAAAVIDTVNPEGSGKYRLLSNVVSSQTDVHALYGGVVPELASRCHAEAISAVTAEALRRADITTDEIGAVAVTFGPGLIGSLLVGVSFAKALASALSVPLIPVNHIEAHAAAVLIEHPDIRPPYLALIVSGGHTSFYRVDEGFVFTEIGASRDDAAGEAFDKVGRVMGLPYPGGAAMDRLAAEGLRRDDYRAIKFPSPAIGDSLEFSFSGLKTAVINYLHTASARLGTASESELPLNLREDIAAALTSVVVDGITSKLRSAAESGEYSAVVMAGGVAANSHLRLAAAELCRELGIAFLTPSLPLCADNGAMTAAAGAELYSVGITAGSDLNAFASDESVCAYTAALRHTADS